MEKDKVYKKFIELEKSNTIEEIFDNNNPPQIIKTNKAVYELSDDISKVNTKKIIKKFQLKSKQFIDNNTKVYRAYTKIGKNKYKSIGIIIVKDNNEYFYLKKENV